MKLRGEITDAQIQRAYQLAKSGKTLTVICTLVGVSYQSYEKYKKDEKDGKFVEPSHLAFLDKIRQGTEEFFGLCEDSVALGISTDPKFALEILARRKSKIYGRKDYLKQEIKQKTLQQNLNIDYSKLTEEEAKKMYEDLHK